ncbi:MAG: sulfite exporter TauE/SafE family protein [Pseudomonadota bacterium]|nr:sulfite exporter TauE/SafE family protein [Pseudomonadota bacterium]MEC8820060.1 sulfite exporter TauE/SafE family protein [Pseudomonadota bacterium]
MMYLLLFTAALITSFISGVLSMAGGMILMGIFSFLLAVPAAMMLHGITQTFSNGSRVWWYRHHIRKVVLIPYTLGAFTILGIFSVTAFIPPAGLIFLLIGLFPFLTRMLPKSFNLDIEQPKIAFLSGLVVTLTQMLAGASGPVLDIFYLQSKLTKEEILGTKAVTQTFGHILKLIYYGSLMMSAGNSLNGWLITTVIVAALLGNFLGSLIVKRISDVQFKMAGRYIVLIIGAIYLAKGLSELLR